MLVKNTKLEAIFYQSVFYLTLLYPFPNLLSFSVPIINFVCKRMYFLQCLVLCSPLLGKQVTPNTLLLLSFIYYHLFWSIFLQITLHILRPNMSRLTLKLLIRYITNVYITATANITFKAKLFTIPLESGSNTFFPVVGN